MNGISEAYCFISAFIVKPIGGKRRGKVTEGGEGIKIGLKVIYRLPLAVMDAKNGDS